VTRKLPLRRAGAAALGAALIGYGVVRSDLVDWDQEPRPPDPGPKLPQNPRKLVLPEPKFGWPVGMQAQDPAQEVRKALKPAARERSNRADLLASTSDQALLIPPEPQVETPPQPVVAEPQAEILPPGPELVRPDQPTDNKIEIAVLNDPLPAPVFGLPPGAGLELPDLPPEFLQQLEQAEAHYADAAEATAEIGPAATDLAQVEAPEPPAQTSSFAPPVLAKANTSAPGPPEQASDPVAEPGPTASVFSNIAAPGTLTRADPALATLADDVDSDHAAAGEEEATAPPAATPASTPPRLASRPVSDGSGVASTSGAAPSVASSGPAPPLSELVPERPETRTRLALASVVPTTAKPGPADQLQIPGSPELDQVEALARANARSLLNFTSGPPSFTYEDELILDVQVKGVEVSDTIFAYGTREGIFLPVGTFARILDLALVLSDGGHYASGWTLDEDRTLTLDLRNGVAILQGKEQVLPPNVAAAFDGEMYLRSDMFQRFLPLDVQIDLRMQRVLLETLEPFPFQERAKREANRIRLASRQSAQELHWPREETPWRLFSVPLVDLEMRALSDRARGDRLEGDFRVSGDLAYLTAEAFLSADTKDGLTASLITLGRTDPDAELLGPLQATSFSFGDISTTSMPIGLRGVTGRGVTLSNTPPESASVFENIDLRGILPDGYEVELYRNDVLIGSTAQAINGQYEFLQVPVDFGLNVLRLVFYGPQGQRSEQVRRITVGDGRLARGKFVYRLGAAQKD